MFRQEFGAVRGRSALQNGAVFALQFAPVGWVSPPRVLNMRVKWLGETKPAASAISVMLNPGVQEHHSRRFPKRIMALHGRQPRFLIPEHPRNIAAENPPVIFRFGDAFRERSCPLRMPELYPSPDGSEVYLCPTTGGLSDKGPRSARRAVFSQVEPQIIHRITCQRKHNPLSQTPSYKYSFRLNEEPS